MPFVLIRKIHPLPGREDEAITWYKETESFRHQAGQTCQTLLRSLVDHADYQLVQEWTSQVAYQVWKRSPERERLIVERARLLIHEPVQPFEIL